MSLVPPDAAAVPDVAALFTAQWRPMLQLAALLVGDRGAAEDVVQDAFVAMQRNLRAPADPEAAVAYLRTVVVNRFPYGYSACQLALTAFHEPQPHP